MRSSSISIVQLAGLLFCAKFCSNRADFGLSSMGCCLCRMGCGAGKARVGKDTTGDGRIDTWYEDTTGDGKFDTVYHDTNGDGIPDKIAIDTDGDGVSDVLKLDTNFDGKFDTVKYDLTGNGKFDRIEIDRSGKTSATEMSFHKAVLMTGCVCVG